MAEGLKPVGIELIAQNAEQFTTATNNAAQAEKQLETTTVELQTITEKERDMMLQMGVNADMVAKQFNVLTEGETANTAATNENATANERAARAHSMWSDETRVHVRDMRILRFETMEYMMGVTLLISALGEALPESARGAAKEINLVTDGVMVGMMVAGPAGAAIGGIAGALVVLSKAAQDTQLEALNKELDSMGKKDDAVQGLMKLSGVTEDEAKKALDAAKSNSTYADEIKRLAGEAENAYNPINELIILLDKLNVSVGNIDFGKTLIQALTQISPTLGIAIMQAQGFKSSLDDMTDAAGRAKTAKDDLNKVVENPPPTDKEIKETEKLRDQFQKAMDDQTKAAIESGQRIQDAQTTAANNSARAWQSYADSVANAHRSLTDSLADLAHTRTVDEQKAAQDRIDAQSKADDEIGKADQELKNRLDDIAFSVQERRERDNENIKTKEKETADKIYDIRRQLVEDTENLGLETAMKLQGAKTENERAKIQEMAMFEQGKLNQRADDAIASAEKQLTKERESIAQRRQLDDEQTQHEIQNAQRSHEQRITQIKEQESQQLASISRRVAQEEAQLEYQAAQYKRREQEQIDDATRRRNEELKRIGEQEALELERIKRTDDAKEIEHRNQMARYAAELFAVLQINDAQRAMVASFTPFYNQTVGSSALVSLTGKQEGGSVVPGQSYIVGERGPEILHQGASGGMVIPLSETRVSSPVTSYGGNSMMLDLGGIHVDARGQDNPEGIANAVMSKVRSEFPGLLTSELNRGQWR